MKKQTLSLKNYLMTHKGGITGNDAWRLLSIQRLPARISELKQAGYDVVSEYETSVNRFGEKVRYKRYWIRETKNGNLQNGPDVVLD